MMRWFTREWATFGLSDEASDVVLREATAHHRALVQRAPRKLRPLFLQREPQIRLDDGRIESITFTGGDTITLGLVQGVLTTGYGLLTIALTDATLQGLTIDELATLVEQGAEVWYFEFDETLGPPVQFEVRFLLLRGGEFGVRFQDAQWTWRSRKGRATYRRRVVRQS